MNRLNSKKTAELRQRRDSPLSTRTDLKAAGVKVINCRKLGAGKCQSRSGPGSLSRTCLGGIGAMIGTLGGAALRARLAQAFGKDFPAALLENFVAIATAILIIYHSA
jgi:uncharacterized membrane protein